MGDATSTESEDSDLVSFETAADMLDLKVADVESMARAAGLTPQATPTGPRYRLGEIKAACAQHR